MRTAKYRAWNSYDNTMLSWEDCCNPMFLSLPNLLNGLIDHIEPLEFTGLKDKNGTEIYEGDILIIDTISNKNRIVKFENGCFWISLMLKGEIKAMYPIHEFEKSEIEIIGNVFENKDLIK